MLLATATIVLVVLVIAVIFLRGKLARLSQHLPTALEQWEEEIKNLEKPKG